MNKSKINLIFSRFKKHNPKPATELIYHTPFELLIAVMLSARSTDKIVNKAAQVLFNAAKTPQAFLDLGINQVKKYIKTIGFFNTKAKNIINACQILVNKYEGVVPAAREELESLPGVGRKTANVILNTLYGAAVIAVDTHVFRVANRIGLAHSNKLLDVENQLLKNIPSKYLKYAHHWLILHGRYICIARKPKCASCYIADLCEFKYKNFQ